MSYGFSVVTGSGSTVTYSNTDTPCGVLLDSFTYTWSTTPLTKYYSSFAGTELHVETYAQSINGTSDITLDINNSGKYITITGQVPDPSTLQSLLSYPLTVVVIGT